MQMRMNGRNALVTGGSQGIGRAIAKHFAASGAQVAIVARGSDALAKAKDEIAAAADAALRLQPGALPPRPRRPKAGPRARCRLAEY